MSGAILAYGLLMALAFQLRTGHFDPPGYHADSDLEDQWSALLIPCGVPASLIVESFTDLTTSGRSDSQLAPRSGHLRFILARLRELRHLARDLRPLRFAIWFHAAANRPAERGRKTRRSADWAGRWMSRFGLDSSEIRRTAELIEVTREHEPGPFDPDAQVMSDIDLAVLGGTPDEYDAYTRGLRGERSLLPGFLYRRRRCARLDELLARDPIYFTPVMREAREVAARSNLLRELATLRFLR